METRCFIIFFFQEGEVNLIIFTRVYDIYFNVLRVWSFLVLRENVIRVLRKVFASVETQTHT